MFNVLVFAKLKPIAIVRQLSTVEITYFNKYFPHLKFFCSFGAIFVCSLHINDSLNWVEHCSTSLLWGAACSWWICNEMKWIKPNCSWWETRARRAATKMNGMKNHWPGQTWMNAEPNSIVMCCVARLRITYMCCARVARALFSLCCPVVSAYLPLDWLAQWFQQSTLMSAAQLVAYNRTPAY